MNRTLLTILLFIVLSGCLPLLSAPSSDQQRQETLLKTQSGFQGTISWWDDGTIKMMYGQYPHTGIVDSVAAVYQTDRLLNTVLPYLKMTRTQLLPTSRNGEVFLFTQQYKGIPLEGNGFIRIFAYRDGNIRLQNTTIPNFYNKTTLVVDSLRAMQIYKLNSDPDSYRYDVVPRLRYYVPINLDADENIKPKTGTLCWIIDDGTYTYYIDANSGYLLHQVRINR